jgi:predicted transcriptional regulator
MIQPPYPDELLYSVFARYHIWSRNPSFKETMHDLFGSKTAYAIVDLPIRLNDLYKRLPQETVNTPDHLIKNHTMLPIYQPFLKRERVDKIIQAMKGNEGYINHKGEISSSKITPPRNFRYCPECVVEDQNKWGEPYWHRTHQIVGVELCPIHLCWLVESDVQLESRRSVQTFQTVPDGEIKFNSPTDKLKYYQHYKEIAKGVYWLLNQVPILGSDLRRKRYVHYLNEMTLTTVTGKVRRQELANALIQYYGLEFLKQVSCDGVDSWLKVMLGNRGTMVHPLRHLLLMGFLGLTPKKFFSVEIEKFSPFGEGPWVCLNPVADHYLQPVITHCDITRNIHNLPVGKFTCDCGFIYSRTGPDKQDSDSHKIGRMISYGPIWDRELLRLKNEEKISNKEIAAILKVSSLIVKNHLKRLNSEEETNVDDKSDQTEEFIKKRKKYRTSWLEAMDKNIDKSKTELQKIATAVYSWLYRNDREWFVQHSPKLKKGNFEGHRVDWNQRDEDMVKQVIDAASKISVYNGKPTRITKKGVGTYIGKYHLLKYNFELLPKTTKVLESVLESKEQFQIRYVKWAAKYLKDNNQDVIRWRILYLTGFDPGFSKKVSDAIDEEVEKYNKKD